MIRNGIDVHYYTQPVDSDDQAVSLVEYLSWHGWTAFKDGADHDQVTIPMDCRSHDDAATKTAAIFSLVANWRIFWAHRDRGVFDLPIYSKD